MEALIQAIRHFIKLSPEEVLRVQELFVQRPLKAGDYFLREGNVCRDVAFIEKGLLRYYMITNGEEQTLHFGRENDFACSYPSYLPQTPARTNIQAVEDTILYTASRENMDLLYRDLKEGERFGRMAIEGVFVWVMEQMNSMYTDTPEQRYLGFLATYPDLAQRLPQYHIASYVGVKPQSLSRIRKRMAER